MSQHQLSKSLNNEAYFLNFMRKWGRSILRSRARMKVQPTQDVLHSDCRTSGEPIVIACRHLAGFHGISACPIRKM